MLARSLTAHDISSLMQYAKIIKIFEIIGNKLPKLAANIAAMSPPPHRTVKMGVQIMFDNGATSGSWLKIETDNGCEQMLAAKVSANALRTNSGHFGSGFAIQYSNRFENKMIPIVDPADNANDTDTDVFASMVIRIIMQRLRAFRGAGLRLAKNENSAMYAINAARNAEIGTAAQIRYDNIK